MRTGQASAVPGVPRGKLRAPVLPSHHIPRPRLSALLDDVPPGGTGVVLGPAGTGKTTAVREWVESLDDRWAWLTLDGRDAEPMHFWRSIVAACRSLLTDAGSAMITDVERWGTASTESMVALMEELGSSEDRFVLVIDDLHLASVEPATRENSWVMGRLPPNLRVVVTARRRPPWPMARLRANGVLKEIGPGDLSFTTCETTVYLDGLLGDPLEPALVKEIVERTEGWVAGVSLTGQALLRRGDDAASIVTHVSGTTPAVAELLEDEVLDAPDGAIVDLLTDTAAVDRLTPELCASVTGRADARDLLVIAEAEQLVERCDDAGGGWRVPRLLRDVLLARLRASGPDRAAGVEARAARWQASAGDLELAARHAIAAGDDELSYELLTAHAPALIGRGALGLVIQWARSINESFLDRDPARHLEVAWVVGFAGATGDADAHLARAAQLEPGGAAAPALAACLAWWATAGCGDVARAKELERNLPAMADEHPAFRLRWLVWALALLAAGDDIGAAAAIGDSARDPMSAVGTVDRRVPLLAELAWLRGELRAARDHSTAAIDAWRATGLRPLRSLLPALRTAARLAAEDRDIETAEELLRIGDESLGETVRTSTPVVQTEVTRSAVLRAAGRAEESLHLLDRLRSQWAAVAVPRAGPALVSLVASEEVRVRLDLGDVAGAEAALHLARSRPERRLLEARVALAAGDRAEATAALDRVRPRTPRFELEAALLRARSTADPIEARRLAGEALARGATYGFLGTLLDEAELHGHYRALYRSTPSRSVSRVVHALQSGHGSGGRARLIEPLTERELDVLRLLPSHLLNQEIAGTLGVSLNTAKTHIKGVYRKLGVDTRSAAVDHARRLGILP